MLQDGIIMNCGFMVFLHHHKLVVCFTQFIRPLISDFNVVLHIKAAKCSLKYLSSINLIVAYIKKYKTPVVQVILSFFDIYVDFK